MAYSDLGAVTLAAGGEQRLAQMSDWQGGNGNGDPVKIAEVVAAAIAASDAIIDGYLATRYAVPIVTPSVLLRNISADGAVYWLLSKRGMATETQQGEQRARESTLKLMASGAIKPAAPQPANAALGPVFIANDSALSRKRWS